MSHPGCVGVLGGKSLGLPAPVGCHRFLLWYTRFFSPLHSLAFLTPAFVLGVVGTIPPSPLLFRGL